MSPRTVPPALAAYLAEMRDIPGGTFQMGCDGYDWEKPIHPVTLSPFRLGRAPVTVAMWQEYVGATGLAMPWPPAWGWIDDHPVVCVSWEDIQTFCVWASDVSGVALSLPTEAQWEFAARGGLEGMAYPWGDAFDHGKLWCSTEPRGTAGRAASVVRSERVFGNGYGLLDMSGNVWQWCLDWFGAGYYGEARATGPDPIGPGEGTERVCRGGAWHDFYPVKFRCAGRDGSVPTGRGDNLGFRLQAGPTRG